MPIAVALEIKDSSSPFSKTPMSSTSSDCSVESPTQASGPVRIAEDADAGGSTFTITNPGQFGAVSGLPIINQRNLAIMGIGGITKQPMVITDKDGADSIAIRSVVHLTLGYDHRVIDGAVADQLRVAAMKILLKNWSEDVG